MKLLKSGFYIFVATIVFFATARTNAQTLDETLSNLGQQAASSYVQPIVSAFGSNLNSGWFNRVPSSSILGLDIELKIVGSGSFFSNDSKTFSADGTFRFTSSQVDQILSNSGITSSHPAYTSIKNEMLGTDFSVNLSGPTVVGSKSEHLVVTFPGATIQGETIGASTIDVNEVTGILEDLPALPMGAVQLGIGTVYGTKAFFRGFPSMEVTDVGKVSFFGFGAMHNPAVWFPNPLPIDIAVGFFTQTLKVGDLMESKATQFGLFASKTFGIGVSVTPYLGLTSESSTTTLKYDYTFDSPAGPQTSHLQFDLEGENTTGVTVGAAFNLIFLNIAADYKIANTNTATLALTFGF
ncbi:MAG: hypothetical protein D6830_03465 [Ignavibacteria bacterium]|nr:MAG: hypothetical protein D6830_03465 [Ignavibacteria bacterium]